MNLSQSFIANLQTTVAIQPTVRAFYDPAMSPQLLGTLNAFACNAWRDAALSQRSPLVFRVIRLVGVQLRGPLAWASHRSLDRADGINGLFHHLDVMHIGRRDSHRERNALALDHQMAFRALFAAIRWILPGLSAPFCAGTADESREARDQSMRSASPSRSSSTWCNFFQTPASCHPLSRRQQVIPLPQPISGGRYSQGSPVESTKRMPLSTSRFGMRGLPPLGFSGSGGSNGSMTSHSSSVINCLAMSGSLHGKLRFC